MPKRILWLNWKDSGHPLAGGAEVVLHEVMRRQVAAGHAVTLLTAAYTGAAAEDIIDGARIIRVGSNRYLHGWQAHWYYQRHLRNRFDYVIEVVNTAPYFVVLAPGKAKPLLLYHQLAGEVWLHETSWPLSFIGYRILEPLATKLLARSKATLLSMSKSTSDDLARHGFAGHTRHIITEGIHIEPVASLDSVTKYRQPTLLSLGGIRGMKRTLDQIKAFELIKQQIPDARLIVAGQAVGAYAQRVLQAIEHSPAAAAIDYRGPVSHTEKRRLMQRCHLILVTSVKEGWGLIVSEANSQGTPAVVYDADGLRDSVIHNKTGLVTTPDPHDLAAAVIGLVQHPKKLAVLGRQAFAFSRTLTFERTYSDIQQYLR